MNRRGFMQAILAAGIAPALVKAASLMPVRRLSSGLLVPELEVFNGPSFTVLENVTAVWVTMIGGGGGGGSGKLVSAYENDRGEIFNKPMFVRPGQTLTVEVGSKRQTTFQWISPDGLLNSQTFDSGAYGVVDQGPAWKRS